MTDLDRAGAKPHPSGVAIQKRVVFAPEDVTSIRLVCRKCGNEVAWNQASATDDFPARCPFCDAHSQHQYSDLLWASVRDFVRLIKINKHEDRIEGRGFRVKFETKAAPEDG